MKNDILHTTQVLEKTFTYKMLPQKIKKPILLWNWLFVLFCILQIGAWFLALFVVGNDFNQGSVYRIMFVHVPIAWCAFFWIFMGGLFSLCVLFFPKKNQMFDLSAHSAMQLGALFSLLVLITGSIWGRPTWGVWWDWDPRLTSSLVMFVVACAYLVLRYTTQDSVARCKMSAFVAILCAINVPIVYYSVNLWRSLHQPQSFVSRSANVSSDIGMVLIINSVVMFLLSIAIYKIKRQALSAKETLLYARGEQQ